MERPASSAGAVGCRPPRRRTLPDRPTDVYYQAKKNVDAYSQSAENLQEHAAKEYGQNHQAVIDFFFLMMVRLTPPA